MKRFIPALAALGLLSCTDANTGLIVQGAVLPTEDAQTQLCDFATGGGGKFLDSEVLQVNGMKARFNGTLSRELGLQVLNVLQQTATESPAGQPVSGNQSDVILEAADVDIDDLNGSSLAHETVVVNAYVPSNGSGIASFDYMAQPMVDLVNSKSDAFDVVLAVTLRGHTTGNSNISTQAFRFPVHVRYDDATTLAASLGDAGAGEPFGTGKCF